MNAENTLELLVKVTATKPVSFRVGGSRQVFKTNNLTAG